MLGMGVGGCRTRANMIETSVQPNGSMIVSKTSETDLPKYPQEMYKRRLKLYSLSMAVVLSRYWHLLAHLLPVLALHSRT